MTSNAAEAEPDPDRDGRFVWEPDDFKVVHGAKPTRDVDHE